MNPQRFLFLDIDGVLNVDSKPYRNRVYPIERHLARRIGQLVTALDARIVISSDWRFQVPLPKLRDLLARYGGMSRRRVVDITVVEDIRGEEIQKWLVTNGLPVRCAILDDNDQGRFSMNAVAPWFVKTDPSVGVSEANIRDVEVLLTTGPIWSLTTSRVA